MYIRRIIRDIKAERDVLVAAIECLEGLTAGRQRQPPAWVVKVTNDRPETQSTCKTIYIRQSA